MNKRNFTSRALYLVLALMPPVAYSKENNCDQFVMQKIKGLSDRGGEQSIALEVSEGIVVEAKIDTTSKGHGGIKLGKDYLSFYDAHDDGRYFENSMLTFCFNDINSDGYKDIFLHGVAINTDYKGDPIGKEFVAFLYLYSKQKNQFIESFKDASFDINLGG